MFEFCSRSRTAAVTAPSSSSSGRVNATITELNPPLVSILYAKRRQLFTDFCIISNNNTTSTTSHYHNHHCGIDDDDEGLPSRSSPTQRGTSAGAPPPSSGSSNTAISSSSVVVPLPPQCQRSSLAECLAVCDSSSCNSRGIEGKTTANYHQQNVTDSVFRHGLFTGVTAVDEPPRPNEGTIARKRRLLGESLKSKLGYKGKHSADVLIHVAKSSNDSHLNHVQGEEDEDDGVSVIVLSGQGGDKPPLLQLPCYPRLCPPMSSSSSQFPLLPVSLLGDALPSLSASGAPSTSTAVYVTNAVVAAAGITQAAMVALLGAFGVNRLPGDIPTTTTQSPHSPSKASNNNTSNVTNMDVFLNSIYNINNNSSSSSSSPSSRRQYAMALLPSYQLRESGGATSAVATGLTWTLMCQLAITMVEGGGRGEGADDDDMEGATVYYREIIEVEKLKLLFEGQSERSHWMGVLLGQGVGGSAPAPKTAAPSSRQQDVPVSTTTPPRPALPTTATPPEEDGPHTNKGSGAIEVGLLGVYTFPIDDPPPNDDKEEEAPILPPTLTHSTAAHQENNNVAPPVVSNQQHTIISDVVNGDAVIVEPLYVLEAGIALKGTIGHKGYNSRGVYLLSTGEIAYGHSLPPTSTSHSGVVDGGAGVCPSYPSPNHPVIMRVLDVLGIDQQQQQQQQEKQQQLDATGTHNNTSQEPSSSLPWLGAFADSLSLSSLSSPQHTLPEDPTMKRVTLCPFALFHQRDDTSMRHQLANTLGRRSTVFGSNNNNKSSSLAAAASSLYFWSSGSHISRSCPCSLRPERRCGSQRDDNDDNGGGDSDGDANNTTTTIRADTIDDEEECYAVGNVLFRPCENRIDICRYDGVERYLTMVGGGSNTETPTYTYIDSPPPASTPSSPSSIIVPLSHSQVEDLSSWVSLVGVVGLGVSGCGGTGSARVRAFSSLKAVAASKYQHSPYDNDGSTTTAAERTETTTHSTPPPPPTTGSTSPSTVHLAVRTLPLSVCDPRDGLKLRFESHESYKRFETLILQTLNNLATSQILGQAASVNTVPRGLLPAATSSSSPPQHHHLPSTIVVGLTSTQAAVNENDHLQNMVVAQKLLSSTTTTTTTTTSSVVDAPSAVDLIISTTTSSIAASLLGSQGSDLLSQILLPPEDDDCDDDTSLLSFHPFAATCTSPSSSSSVLASLSRNTHQFPGLYCCLPLERLRLWAHTHRTESIASMLQWAQQYAEGAVQETLQQLGMLTGDENDSNTTSNSRRQPHHGFLQTGEPRLVALLAATSIHNHYTTPPPKSGGGGTATTKRLTNVQVPMDWFVQDLLFEATAELAELERDEEVPTLLVDVRGIVPCGFIEGGDVVIQRGGDGQQHVGADGELGGDDESLASAPPIAPVELLSPSALAALPPSIRSIVLAFRYYYSYQLSSAITALRQDAYTQQQLQLAERKRLVELWEEENNTRMSANLRPCPWEVFESVHRRDAQELLLQATTKTTTVKGGGDDSGGLLQGGSNDVGGAGVGVGDDPLALAYKYQDAQQRLERPPRQYEWSSLGHTYTPSSTTKIIVNIGGNSVNDKHDDITSSPLHESIDGGGSPVATDLNATAKYHGGGGGIGSTPPTTTSPPPPPFVPFEAIRLAQTELENLLLLPPLPTVTDGESTTTTILGGTVGGGGGVVVGSRRRLLFPEDALLSLAAFELGDDGVGLRDVQMTSDGDNDDDVTSTHLNNILARMGSLGSVAEVVLSWLPLLSLYPSRVHTSTTTWLSEATALGRGDVWGWSSPTTTTSNNQSSSSSSADMLLSAQSAFMAVLARKAEAQRVEEAAHQERVRKAHDSQVVYLHAVYSLSTIVPAAVESIDIHEVTNAMNTNTNKPSHTLVRNNSTTATANDTGGNDAAAVRSRALSVLSTSDDANINNKTIGQTLLPYFSGRTRRVLGEMEGFFENGKYGSVPGGLPGAVEKLLMLMNVTVRGPTTDAPATAHLTFGVSYDVCTVNLDATARQAQLLRDMLTSPPGGGAMESFLSRFEGEPLLGPYIGHKADYALSLWGIVKERLQQRVQMMIFLEAGPKQLGGKASSFAGVARGGADMYVGGGGVNDITSTTLSNTSALESNHSLASPTTISALTASPHLASFCSPFDIGATAAANSVDSRRAVLRQAVSTIHGGTRHGTVEEALTYIESHLPTATTTSTTSTPSSLSNTTMNKTTSTFLPTQQNWIRLCALAGALMVSLDCFRLQFDVYDEAVLVVGRVERCLGALLGWLSHNRPDDDDQNDNNY